MRNSIRLIIAIAVVVVFSGSLKTDNDIFYQIAKSIDIFGKVYKEVSFNYVDDINPEEFMLSGINGMLGSLDPYTVFIDEKRKDDIDLLTHGKYGGIGVSIGMRNDKVTIVDVLDGYAAQRQGLRIGDIISNVDDVEINKDNFDEISRYVKGEPGTQVKLTILRDGGAEKLVFNLIREEVKVKNLLYSGFEPENSNNVYLKLTSFTRTAGDEIRNTLVGLGNKKKINSIVLDLRGNPGGLLDAAVDVCEKFLSKNQLVVSVMGRDSSSLKKYFSTEEPVGGNTKLVVLVDSNSASASEIVAGAIQDHDRGIIVGTETFGKGLVQTVFPLSYNTSIKITTARYYTPSGRCIQKIDYSKGTNSVSTNTVAGKQSFKTDNNRPVFSSGGIKPDSVIEANDELSLTRELVSKGLVFKFATQYKEKNSREKFVSEKDNELFTKFLEFLKNENFVYENSAEKKIDELLHLSKKEKYGKNIIDELNNFSVRYKNLRKSELENHKNEIIDLISTELFNRYDGSNGRIKYSLTNDRQFMLALDILKNEAVYNKLLLNK
ncbi:MAG: S41 family peptidase [Ignavibacteriales bacterium]|nr:MAG: S41 family peptidase [Ignavibacteriales bacterium]